jgi:hypothetical protein
VTRITDRGGPVGLLLDILNGPAGLALDGAMPFALAVLGAVTLGWSLTLSAAIQAAHQLGGRARPIWIMLAGGVGAWWALDSALSVATGFGLNVIPNVLFLAAFLVPVLRSGVLGERVAQA